MRLRWGSLSRALTFRGRTPEGDVEHDVPIEEKDEQPDDGGGDCGVGERLRLAHRHVRVMLVPFLDLRSSPSVAHSGVLVLEAVVCRAVPGARPREVAVYLLFVAYPEMWSSGLIVDWVFRIRDLERRL